MASVEDIADLWYNTPVCGDAEEKRVIEKMNVRTVGWMERLRRMSAVACVAMVAMATAYADEATSAIPGMDPVYVGVAGTLSFRHGGGRVGGGDIRIGAELSDVLSPELDAGWHEKSAFLALRDIVHFSAFDLYDRFFGYSRFDPFFMLGGGGWVGGFRQYGPLAGIGTFWHLDDNWSVRVDASAMLGLDGECEMLYSVSAGLQYSFGE